MPWMLLALACAVPVSPADAESSPELTVHVVPGPDHDEDGSPPAYDCDDRDPRIGDLRFATAFTPDEAEPVEPLGPWAFDGGRARPARGLQSLLVDETDAADLAVQALAILGEPGAAALSEPVLAGVLGRVAPAGPGLREGLRCAVILDEDGAALELARVRVAAGRGVVAAETLARTALPAGPDLEAGAALGLALWGVGERASCTLETESGDAFLVAAEDPEPLPGAVGITARHAAFDALRACRAWVSPTPEDARRPDRARRKSPAPARLTGSPAGR